MLPCVRCCCFVFAERCALVAVGSVVGVVAADVVAVLDLFSCCCLCCCLSLAVLCCCGCSSRPCFLVLFVLSFAVCISALLFVCVVWPCLLLSKRFVCEFDVFVFMIRFVLLSVLFVFCVSLAFCFALCL